MDTSTQIVTYTIMDSANRRYYVDEYSPDEYHEIGDYIIIPIYVKTFKKNNGEIGHSFAVQQQFNPARGENFWRLQIHSFQFCGVFKLSVHTLYSTNQRPSGRLGNL